MPDELSDRLWLALLAQAKSLEEKKKLPSPADPQAFPPDQQGAAIAVAAWLLKDGEDPREFHARVRSEDDGNVLVFHLWHESAFVAIEKAAKEGHFILGNPSGKCRDVYYNLKSKNVSHSTAAGSALRRTMRRFECSRNKAISDKPSSR